MFFARTKPQCKHRTLLHCAETSLSVDYLQLQKWRAVHPPLTRTRRSGAGRVSRTSKEPQCHCGPNCPADEAPACARATPDSSSILSISKLILQASAFAVGDPPCHAEALRDANARRVLHVPLKVCHRPGTRRTRAGYLGWRVLSQCVRLMSTGECAGKMDTTDVPWWLCSSAPRFDTVHGASVLIAVLLRAQWGKDSPTMTQLSQQET